jgi:NAD-dependent deacetylase
MKACLDAILRADYDVSVAEKELGEQIDALAELIVKSRRIVVFTGAGISTESGIPDFRSPGGVWSRFDPDDFTYQQFLHSEEGRKRHWQLLKQMGEMMAVNEPNPAHHAIAELQKLGKLDCVITQNVDGFHQRAGNSEDKVVQLHGSMSWVKCLSCGKRHSMDEILEWLKQGIEVPQCVECRGILKPEVVFFGEAMPVGETIEAERRSRNCDLCIVVGSSLVVFPAAFMPMYALQSGAKLAIVNEGATDMDDVAHVRIYGRAGEVLSQVMPRVRERLRWGG